VYASGKDFKCVNAITPNGIPTASADVGILYGIFFFFLIIERKKKEKRELKKNITKRWNIITESFCATQCPVIVRCKKKSIFFSFYSSHFILLDVGFCRSKW
jgi:hypothetical protein